MRNARDGLGEFAGMTPGVALPSDGGGARPLRLRERGDACAATATAKARECGGEEAWCGAGSGEKWC